MAFDPDKFLAETAPVAQGDMRTPPSVTQGFDPDKFLAETSGDQVKGRDIAKYPDATKDPANWESGKPGYGVYNDKSGYGQTDLKQVLPAAGQLADLPGGGVRTGLASAAGLVSGHPNFVTPDDLKRAAVGQAPTTDEYLERAGVPEGKYPLLGPFAPDVSLRKAAGFIGDVATDPLTLINRGEKAIRPLSEGAESAGKSMYKSGLKKVDERLIEKGKKPLSDIMLENGAPVGTTRTIAEKAGEISKGLLKERGAAYDTAKEAGVKADLEFPLPNAEEELKKIRSSPSQKSQKLADDLESMMNDYKKAGKVDLDKLSEWKSDLYDDLPDSAFAGAKVKKAANRFQKALARDFKEAIEEGGNAAQSGLGDKIKNINENLGSLIQGEKPLEMQIRRANTKNTITPIDALLAVLHPGAEVAKKTAELGNLTAVRTAGGKGLMGAGKSGLLDAAANRGLINKSKKKGLVNTEEDKRPSLIQSEGE